ncbi:uncharacterized protein [Phyllobates terribilis]|uniref:uncharacterized protein isoform X1 n=1 Tax=Phyllobates terribilis TaxID=111132 RepID=UPI003CCB0D38
MPDTEGSSTATATASTTAAAVMPFTMPYIPGATWLPQYSGESHTLNDFRERLDSLFQVYPLTEEQKVSILVAQLIGAAQREVKSWPPGRKRTVREILARLKDTFDTRTSAEIKLRFYGCKQRAHESIRDYALNLQEALRAIKQADPDSVGNEDKLLTEQFIEGLLCNAHRTQLRAMALQDPDLDFAQFKDRAIRVLREPAPGGAVTHRRPAITYHQETAPLSAGPVGADAQALNSEPATDLHHQVQELTKSVAALTRTVQSLQVSSPGKIQLASGPEGVPWRRLRRTPPARGRPSDRYNEDGRPICRRCNQPGHVARYCHLNGHNLG